MRAQAHALLLAQRPSSSTSAKGGTKTPAHTTRAHSIREEEGDSSPKERAGTSSLKEVLKQTPAARAKQDSSSSSNAVAATSYNARLDYMQNNLDAASVVGAARRDNNNGAGGEEMRRNSTAQSRASGGGAQAAAAARETFPTQNSESSARKQK